MRYEKIYKIFVYIIRAFWLAVLSDFRTQKNSQAKKFLAEKNYFPVATIRLRT